MKRFLTASNSSNEIALASKEKRAARDDHRDASGSAVAPEHAPRVLQENKWTDLGQVHKQQRASTLH
jgi:hypothetical protein